MKKTICTLAIFSALISCNSHQKKVIAYIKGKAQFEEATHSLLLKDGGGHNEEVINMTGSGNQTIQIKTTDEIKNTNIDGDGLFILNAKNDTIVGGFVKYSDPKERKQVKTQASLKQDIDSLKNLILGANVSVANKTFFILPYQSVKISDNIMAEVVGPFHRMTSTEIEDGKTPEVYRFYSIQEIRETIDKLVQLTQPEKAPQ